MTQNFHVCAICCRSEIDNDVIDNVGMGVPIKCGDCRSNGFRDIRGADFVSNERTNEQKLAYSNSAKRYRVSPKNDLNSFARGSPHKSSQGGGKI